MKIKAARVATKLAYPCSFGPFQCSGRSRGSGSVPCRESSFLAAVLATAGGGLCNVEGKRNGEGQKHASIDPFMQRRGSVTQLYKYFVKIEK